MNILILEDDSEKLESITCIINEEIGCAKIAFCDDFSSFILKLSEEKYDLIFADLVVPFVRGREPENVVNELVFSIRSGSSRNFKTPVIAITAYDNVADEGYSNLNENDITAITYSAESDQWKVSVRRKLESCRPDISYEFVIVCALECEADAYVSLQLMKKDSFSHRGLLCREIEIDGRMGCVVIAPRMGLVNAAIICTKAIEVFSPKLICMSGICAGIDGKAAIYDVVIPDLCFQHDSGKWSDSGFIPEPYSVQLDHSTHMILKGLVGDPGFLSNVVAGVVADQGELPENETELRFNIVIAPASSGSAVVADEMMQEIISDQHRKSTAFEMESYALYESARQSANMPKYFSAKSVVDNGNSMKGDRFHRVACLISAKVVYEIIKCGKLYQ